MRSFGGVLAHEFGHFAQGLGMRPPYIVRSVNGWFARVVYERDWWDVKLEEVAESWDGWISIILHIARFFVWLSRRILWRLTHVGHAINCFALRQMEYDADRYEVQFAGSETFAKTSHRLQMLGIDSSHALQLVQESWNERKLSRNLPQLERCKRRVKTGTLRAQK